MQREARALEPFATSDLAKRFLAVVPDLPPILPRVAYRDEKTREWYSKAAADKLEPAAREKLTEKTLDDEFYYHTKYGTPLAYVRAIDILTRYGISDVSGKRIVDFGYGTVGHLRLLALLGADAVGVDVDTLLPALYSEPSDQGKITGPLGRDGSIQLVHGHWPSDPMVKESVGGGVNLFLSKNTLKRGYIHPEREADPARLVHLGVDDAAFLREVFNVLKSGGIFLIYNLAPAPAPLDKPYIPWADGRCPFDRSLCESTGFRVLAFDEDDTPAARQMGHLLGWDEGEDAMNLENDLFGSYTMLRKP